MTKQKKYRQKQIAQGRCPRCGSPCFPYYECDKHRDMQKITYCLNRLVIAGDLLKENGTYSKAINKKPLKKIRCLFYKKSPNDRRILPRIGKQYINLDELIISTIRKNGPITENQIASIIKEKIAQTKKAAIMQTTDTTF